MGGKCQEGLLLGGIKGSFVTLGLDGESNMKYLRGKVPTFALLPRL